MKLLDKYKDRPEILKFIDRLDIKNKEKYLSILKSVVPYDSSFVKNKCVPVRNATMHYSDNKDDLIRYLTDFEEGKIIINGNKAKDVDLEFADDCATYLSFGHIASEEVPIFIEEISVQLLQLMSFIEEIIPIYLS